MEKLYRIEAPHFVAGVISQHEYIRVAAPILGWAIGKSTAGLISYCRRKKWRVECISTAVQLGRY
jgi:hypothetical protein